MTGPHRRWTRHRQPDQSGRITTNRPTDEPTPSPAEAVPAADGAHPDARLLAALRAGDEAEFRRFVAGLTPMLLALARRYVDTRGAAEDVVQETWLAVLAGLDRFEQRSSLRTWVIGILVHQARRSGVRDRRSLPFSSVRPEPSVDPARFDRTGRWAVPPLRWDTEPEERLAAAELRAVIDAAIAGLPRRQREVITLRDVLGMDAADAGLALGVTDANQRVLLHRARSRVRAAVERYADRAGTPPERRRG